MVPVTRLPTVDTDAVYMYPLSVTITVMPYKDISDWPNIILRFNDKVGRAPFTHAWNLNKIILATNLPNKSNLC